MKLILFDIDGTLLISNGVGREAKRLAMLEVFGTQANVHEHPFGGKTDWQLLTEMLGDLHTADEIGERMAHYEQIMAKHMQAIVTDYQVEPCSYALDLINTLRQREALILGIVTGNTSQTAPIKLVAGGFNPKWFAVGAYGNESANRDDLPKLALQRAIAYTGVDLQPHETIIIGDTPDDVRCARALGGIAVAVKTGYSTEADLVAAEPDFLLDDLRQFPELRLI